MNESKTPRTDAAAKDDGGSGLVIYKFASHLETELAELQQKCESIGVIRDNQSRCIGDWMNYRDQIETELAASKAREDKLVSAMRDIANIPLGMLSPEYAMFDIASAALEAWRAAK